MLMRISPIQSARHKPTHAVPVYLVRLAARVVYCSLVPRKNYTGYNDTRHLSEKETEMKTKNVITTLKSNKSVIVKKTLIIGAAAAGVIIAGALVFAAKSVDVDAVVEDLES